MRRILTWLSGAKMAEPVGALSFLAFNIAIFGVLITPGPAFILLIRSCLADGRVMAVRTGLGLACAAVTWSVLALAGLTALFALAPAAYLVMKFLGVAYILWFAYGLWRNANKPVEAVAGRRLKGFWLGYAANIANPKAVLFIAAIFSTIFPQAPGIELKLLILANHLALEMAFYTFFACVMTTMRIRAAYLRVKAPVDRLAALLLGALAARIATS